MKVIDKFLFFYSTLFASILMAGAILSGFALENTIVIILLIPVIGYLGYQSFIALKALKKNPPQKNQTSSPSSNSNSPQHLKLLQLTSPSYLVTVTLFFLVISATIFKTTLNFQSTSQLVSPIPTSQLTK